MSNQPQKKSANAPASIVDARNQILESGSLKFNLDLTSGEQVYQAAKKWADTDSRVLSAALRSGGENQIALDFRFEFQDYKEMKGGRSLEKIYKAFFDKELTKGALMGWDYGDSTAVIK